MEQDKASSTAYTVLQGTLYTANKSQYASLVSEDVITACQQILQASEIGRARLKQLESKSYNLLASFAEKILMPGITLHYVLRKRYIEEVVREALTDGVTQVVNLGAGFDCLAWRLHKEYSEVNFIEIDHPATNAEKEKALFDTQPENLSLLAIDFSQTDTKGALSQFDRFDPSRPTIYICEGVLMYLKKQDVDLLFKNLKELTGTSTRIVFSALEPMSSANNNTGLLLRIYLKLVSEPLNWTISSTDISEFLDKQAFKLLEIADTPLLAEKSLKGIKHGTLHKGEYLVLARVKEA
ncbi:class I SAM-dependent methyltransferase [Catenovulum sediminis]|uniref:class I SAM-dependent methyltransferase n=1 Tax=Catenovulum sediminis TaxID=1740262 RepID=UPI0011810283|nr:class I SAM-dependent methyltransferase [Catenovulum sediminis]